MKKWIKRIILIVLAIGIIVAGTLTMQGFALYQEVISEVSLAVKVEEVRENPEFVQLEDISQDFLNAIVCVEDRNFYHHGAVNITSLIRAVLTNIQEGSYVEGGSTITQQVAKNLYFTQEKVMVRKVAELFVAWDLEREYSKDDILELYVNIVYYGDGYYGVGQASRGYFEKKPIELSFYESTLLAGLPQAPSAYALSNHAEKAYIRQQEVIDSMIYNDYLTEEEAEERLQN